MFDLDRISSPIAAPPLPRTPATRAFARSSSARWRTREAVLKGLGEPGGAELQKLHHAADLTVLNVIWGRP